MGSDPKPRRVWRCHDCGHRPCACNEPEPSEVNPADPVEALRRIAEATATFEKPYCRWCNEHIGNVSETPGHRRFCPTAIARAALAALPAPPPDRVPEGWRVEWRSAWKFDQPTATRHGAWAGPGSWHQVPRLVPVSQDTEGEQPCCGLAELPTEIGDP